MQRRDIKSIENKNYLSYILELEKFSFSISERSAHIYNTVATLNCNNFIRAKRIVHETLFDHYIVPVNDVRLPATIQDASNTTTRYRCLPYKFVLDALMSVAEDMYHFALVNLETKDTIAIRFSDSDVEAFITHTRENVVRREEKYDYMHSRIKNFVKGKKMGSRTTTPIPEPLEIPEFPDWWPIYNIIHPPVPVTQQQHNP